MNYMIIPTWDWKTAYETAKENLSPDTAVLDWTTILVTPEPPPKRGAPVAMKWSDRHDVTVKWLDQHEGVPVAMNEGWAMAQDLAEIMDDDTAEIYLFLHDDVTIFEPGWDAVLVSAMRNFGAGIAGFGGAPGLGTRDLYRRPYELNQLARVGGFVSNMVEAESHGARAAFPQYVSVLDGFAIAITNEAYNLMGGWARAVKEGLPIHHMYDAWIACRAAELGIRTVMVPVNCHHAGGGTSVRRAEEFEALMKREGYTDGGDVHSKAHEFIYNRFRNVLPLTVENGGRIWG